MTEFSLMTAAQQTATINDMMAGCVRSALTIFNHLTDVLEFKESENEILVDGIKLVAKSYKENCDECYFYSENGCGSNDKNPSCIGIERSDLREIYWARTDDK